MITSQQVTEAIYPLRTDLTALRDALHQPPRVAIRLRRGLRPESLPFAVDPVPWHPQGYFVDANARPGAQRAFAAGDYYIQDAASLLAITALAPEPGERICDLCAAPGGKSTAILESLKGRGWLLANEPVQSRLAALEFNLARQGEVRYLVSAQDPELLATRYGSLFDAVLVDAPCSGQSLIGRGKQTESAFATRTIAHCAARQARILQSAAQLVRPGGRLVYSTCTFAVAENEGQVEQFLASHADWSLETVTAAEPWQSEWGPGHYRLWPQQHGCGGAYAARLRRWASSPPQMPPDTPQGEARMRLSSWPEGFAEWGMLRDVQIFRVGSQTFAWPHPVDLDLLAVAVFGPEIGFRKGATWFPAYALAMRRDERWSPRCQITLDDGQASSYLAGAPLTGTQRGWGVATWQGRALGWLKGDGRRLKNHLPKPGRIAVAS